MKHSDIAHFRQLTVLKRNFNVRSRRFPPVVEPAAMVDVVLLVLIFFIYSSSFVTRPGVRLTLPAAEQAEGLPLNAMVVTLTRQNVVFFNDRRTSLEDLPAEFSRVRFEQPDLPLIIEADEQVSYGVITRVHQAAVTAGIREIAGATRKPGIQRTEEP